MRKYIFYSAVFLLAASKNSIAQISEWKMTFANPPSIFRPMPFWHLNGKLTNGGIDSQMYDIKNKSNFGGITVLPVTSQPDFSGKNWYPGMEPAYLTEEYFGFYKRILDDADKYDLHAVWYDDVDFPSGSAGGQMKKLYPGDTRKILSKKDTTVSGGVTLEMVLPKGKLMAAVAMNTQTKARIDIRSSVTENGLVWKGAPGEWKVMVFTCDVVNSTMANDIAVDYMDPVAIQKYINLNYEPFARHLKKYIGTTIRQTFFDDVGFFTLGSHGERTWTNGFNEKYKSLYGKDPALYYPALWEDIGPETEAARVSLFNTRAVLLSEGFPKVITEWCKKQGLKSSGHPPGNYEIQPVDMNGDILKYYRYQTIPLMDLIFAYDHGREGFKLISSAANLYDKPVVTAEIYGAIGWFGGEKFNRKTLYKAAMDVFSRGINFLIPHGMWYNPDSNAVRIPPLISEYSAEIGPELKSYNDWAGRSCALLQGGKTVTDIAIVYPIASLEAWFYFNAKATKGIQDWGKFAAPETDYLAVGDMLTREVHRDFTFIHPEILAGSQCTLSQDEIILNNTINQQHYKLLILPGGKVISVGTLEKIKAFYDHGGKLIATSLLPSRSAEFGEDAKVVKIIKEMFGIDPLLAMPSEMTAITRNAKGGKLVFIPKPSSENISRVCEQMELTADLSFEENPRPNSGKGSLSYIHKNKEGKDIYFFANSTDDSVHTFVRVRGTIKPVLWDPYTGTTTPISKVTYLKTRANQEYTRFPLSLIPVRSVFVVAE